MGLSDPRLLPKGGEYLYEQQDVLLKCLSASMWHHPKDRPGMSSVVLMLTSESHLPQPKEPAFFVESISASADSSSSNHEAALNQRSTPTSWQPRRSNYSLYVL